MDNPYIEFRNIDKIFPGQQALKEVSFSVNKGEVHALLGENGAGKSTLLNIFHGVLSPTGGEIIIDGKRCHFSSAQEALHAGVVKVHQEINLIPEMSVMDNIFLGCEDTHQGLLDRKAMREQTKNLLDSLKCAFWPEDKVNNLNMGEMQMVQIARALQHNAKIISFDEPTSSLTTNEVNTLFKVIQKLKTKGITILYISHKLDEIYQICDRATILRDGSFITTVKVDGLPKEQLIKNMVGRDVSMFAKRLRPPNVNWKKVVLKVKQLSGVKGFKEINFELHQGEILGFFGLVGAKRTETMRGIFGADPLTDGSIELHNKRVEIRSPEDATRLNIGLVPENRKEQGFVKGLSNMDNISLASLGKFTNRILQNQKKKWNNSLKVGQKVGLSPNDPGFITSDLSGGNQQKVVVSKWLSTNADILILDEPTKGIDVGAKAEIYSLMEGLTHEGKSIIMISGELPEIIGMSDRIAVMHDGRIAQILDKDEFDEATILTYAVGGKINAL